MIRKIKMEVFETPDHKVHATYAEAEQHVHRHIENRLARLISDVAKESISPEQCRRVAASLTKDADTIDRLADAIAYIYPADDEVERPEEES